jgi:hypothetical protein
MTKLLINIAPNPKEKIMPVNSHQYVKTALLTLITAIIFGSAICGFSILWKGCSSEGRAERQLVSKTGKVFQRFNGRLQPHQ